MKNLLLGTRALPIGLFNFFAKISSKLLGATTKPSTEDKPTKIDSNEATKLDGKDKPTKADETNNKININKQYEDVRKTDDIKGLTIRRFTDDVLRYKHTNRQASMNYATRSLDSKDNEHLPPIHMNDATIPTRFASFHMKKDFVDARSCWYSIERLKRFIQIMEDYSNLLSSNKKSELGIRFYYATYTEDSSILYDPLYAGCHTLYLVPTKKIGGFDIDFDPRALGSDGNPIFTRLDQLISGAPGAPEKESEETELFIMGGDETIKDVVQQNMRFSDTNEDAPMNQGGLCPPYNLNTNYSDGNSTMQAIDKP